MRVFADRNPCVVVRQVVSAVPVRFFDTTDYDDMGLDLAVGIPRSLAVSPTGL